MTQPLEKNKDSVNFVIPLRDREQDLQLLLQKLQEYVDIDYQVFIIEQCAGKEFNKGLLDNIGFIESNKTNFSNYYIFTDVDIIPKKKTIIPYRCMEGMNHLYGHWFSLGCLFATDKNTYQKLNGFSNQYWGWGYEDTDLQVRCELLNIPINRSCFIEREDVPLRHSNYLNNEKNIDLIDHALFSEEETNQRLKINLPLFQERCASYKENIKNIETDGILNCQYQILQRQLINKNMHRILVEI